MPDFTIENYWFCESSRSYSRRVGSTTGGGKTYLVEYCYQQGGECQYDWQCECPSFRFRRQCRHVTEVKALPYEQGGRCGWHQWSDGGDVVWTRVKGSKHGTPHCPRCGGPVAAERWAV